LNSGKKTKASFNFEEDEEMSRMKLKANRSQNDLRFNATAEIDSDEESCEDEDMRGDFDEPKKRYQSEDERDKDSS